MTAQELRDDGALSAIRRTEEDIIVPSLFVGTGALRRYQLECR